MSGQGGSTGPNASNGSSWLQRFAASSTTSESQNASLTSPESGYQGSVGLSLSSSAGGEQMEFDHDEIAQDQPISVEDELRVVQQDLERLKAVERRLLQVNYSPYNRLEQVPPVVEEQPSPVGSEAVEQFTLTAGAADKSSAAAAVESSSVQSSAAAAVESSPAAAAVESSSVQSMAGAAVESSSAVQSTAGAAVDSSSSVQSTAGAAVESSSVQSSAATAVEASSASELLVTSLLAPYQRGDEIIAKIDFDTNFSAQFYAFGEAVDSALVKAHALILKSYPQLLRPDREFVRVAHNACLKQEFDKASAKERLFKARQLQIFNIMHTHFEKASMLPPPFVRRWQRQRSADVVSPPNKVRPQTNGDWGEAVEEERRTKACGAPADAQRTRRSLFGRTTQHADGTGSSLVADDAPVPPRLLSTPRHRGSGGGGGGGGGSASTTTIVPIDFPDAPLSYRSRLRHSSGRVSMLYNSGWQVPRLFDKHTKEIDVNDFLKRNLPGTFFDANGEKFFILDHRGRLPPGAAFESDGAAKQAAPLSDVPTVGVQLQSLSIQRPAATAATALEVDKGGEEEEVSTVTLINCGDDDEEEELSTVTLLNCDDDDDIVPETPLRRPPLFSSNVPQKRSQPPSDSARSARPPAPLHSASSARPPARLDSASSARPPAPLHSASSARPPARLDSASSARPPAPSHSASSARPPARLDSASSARPPAPLHSASSARPPAPSGSASSARPAGASGGASGAQKKQKKSGPKPAVSRPDVDSAQLYFPTKPKSKDRDDPFIPEPADEPHSSSSDDDDDDDGAGGAEAVRSQNADEVDVESDGELDVDGRLPGLGYRHAKAVADSVIDATRRQGRLQVPANQKFAPPPPSTAAREGAHLRLLTRNAIPDSAIRNEIRDAGARRTFGHRVDAFTAPAVAALNTVVCEFGDDVLSEAGRLSALGGRVGIRPSDLHHALDTVRRGWDLAPTPRQMRDYMRHVLPRQLRGIYLPRTAARLATDEDDPVVRQLHLSASGSGPGGGPDRQEAERAISDAATELAAGGDPSVQTRRSTSGVQTQRRPTAAPSSSNVDYRQSSAPQMQQTQRSSGGVQMEECLTAGQLRARQDQQSSAPQTQRSSSGVQTEGRPTSSLSGAHGKQQLTAAQMQQTQRSSGGVQMEERLTAGQLRARQDQQSSAPQTQRSTSGVQTEGRPTASLSGARGKQQLTAAQTQPARRPSYAQTERRPTASLSGERRDQQLSAAQTQPARRPSYAQTERRPTASLSGERRDQQLSAAQTQRSSSGVQTEGRPTSSLSGARGKQQLTAAQTQRSSGGVQTEGRRMAGLSRAHPYQQSSARQTQQRTTGVQTERRPTASLSGARGDQQSSARRAQQRVSGVQTDRRPTVEMQAPPRSILTTPGSSSGHRVAFNPFHTAFFLPSPPPPPADPATYRPQNQRPPTKKLQGRSKEKLGDGDP